MCARLFVLCQERTRAPRSSATQNVGPTANWDQCADNKMSDF